MARSLTVKHEETLSVSPLFAGFVLLAITCLMLSAASGWSDADAATPLTPVPIEAAP
jgi:hypothetical protein